MVSYYLADHLGSIIQESSTAGAITLEREYDPWGVLTQGASTSGYAFTGREWDSVSGLNYLRARYYKSESGAFLTEDPIGFDGGDNFFSYVSNAPTSLSDPFGLYGIDEFFRDSAQFSAGLGDNLSFGGTSQIRKTLGIDDVIDKEGGIYNAGEWTGIALSTMIGGGAGLRTATKTKGKEFSHWIPKRKGGPRSPYNGNYVTPRRHYKHDPYRYPPGNRNWGPKWPRPIQQVDRIPNVYKGGAAGGAYGGASMMVNCSRS